MGLYIIVGILCNFNQEMHFCYVKLQKYSSNYNSQDGKYKIIGIVVPSQTVKGGLTTEPQR